MCSNVLNYNILALHRYKRGALCFAGIQPRFSADSGRGAQEGYDLAIKLSRMAVKYTQPSAEMRDKLRPVYGEDAV